MRIHLREACLAWALLVALLAPAARAQDTVNTASVGGRVLDPQGAVVPGASVIARELETNLTRETTTGADGRFRFAYLKVGRYAITVHCDGFADATRELTVTLGSAFDLPISLSLPSLEAEVSVSADAAVLETARSQIAATISSREVQTTPLNGRNFLDLALVASACASPTNVASTQLFAETSAVPGGGLSVGSQRNLSNNFIVDGLSSNDDAAALTGMTYSVDAIDQFQVVSSGGQAELGRALGGYFNVVTRSGTNTPHGSLYGYFRDDALNAANPLLHRTLPMDQQQGGGSYGGPLQRDRTFLFTNVELKNLDQSGLTTVSDENVALINARLAAVGYPGAPVATGVYPNPVRSRNYLAKVDRRFGYRDQLSVRYSAYDVTAQNSRGAGGLNAPSASAALDNLDQAIALSNVWVISSSTVNETRAQISHGSLEAPATDPIGPAVAIAGVASFGTSSGSPTARMNTLYEVVDNLTHQAGAHSLRAGVDVIYNDDTITYPRSVRGSYTFSSMANFLAGVYNNSNGFTQTFGTDVVSQRNPNVGIYAQDVWKLRQLTLNAGLRYDLQFLETIRTDRNNVSPRIGFAWSPLESQRLVVRGGAGLFFDRVPLRAVANAILSANNTSDVANLRQISISLGPAQAGAPAFPAILPAPVPSVTLPSLTTMNPAMQNAYSRQANVEVERQIGERSSISAGVDYTGGRSLIISINQNVPSCVATGTNNGCRPNPTYANNNQYSPSARSQYAGGHVSFVRRQSRWGQYRVSYTYSKAMSNVGEFFFSSPIDPFDLEKDWGRSDSDQRHRLVFNGAITLRGFQVSGMMQAYSAVPFNVTSGVTTLQGTAGRPIVDGEFIPRNAGEGPDFFSLGMRVSRVFVFRDRMRFEPFVEGFNLTNHMNVVTVQGNFGSGAYPTSPVANFGTPTAVSDPRSFQFGARFSF